MQFSIIIKSFVEQGYLMHFDMDRSIPSSTSQIPVALVSTIPTSLSWVLNVKENNVFKHELPLCRA